MLVLRPTGPLLSFGEGHFRNCLAMTMRVVFCLGAFYEDGLSQVCEIMCRHLLSFNLDRTPVSSLARDSLPESFEQQVWWWKGGDTIEGQPNRSLTNYFLSSP